MSWLLGTAACFAVAAISLSADGSELGLVMLLAALLCLVIDLVRET